MDFIIVLTVGIFIIGFIIGKPLLIKWRRQRLKTQHFPLRWKLLLEKRLSIYRRLPDSLKQQLHGHIQVFLTEKQFIGCGGLAITDEIKITIAAQACLLLLNRHTNYYPDLQVILVYPSVFVVQRHEKDAAGVYTDKREVLAGESWEQGKVIISWEDVQYDAKNINDGENVVFHEFAHQLDHESGSTDGAPLLESRSHYMTWANILSQEYQKLRKQMKAGELSVINYYGANNPAEFFAVATETFFEKSFLMKRLHPKLYEQLKNYYQVDPSEW